MAKQGVKGQDMNMRKQDTAAYDDETELSREERELLEQMMTGDFTGVEERPDIPVRQTFSPVPLSFGQQRLWILDQLVPGNPFYNIPMACRLQGDFDSAVLERSVNEIIRRHQSLRTVFKTLEEEPVQEILPELTLDIPMISLEHLSGEQQEKEVVRLAESEAVKPFDLASPPLLRLTLLRLGKQEQVLLFTIHHIISDTWSMNNFMRELGVLYRVLGTGQPSPLPDLAVQYPDYSLWQRQRLQKEEIQTQLSFWRGMMGGDIPLLQLPADFPRPAVQTFRGGAETFELDEKILQKIRALITPGDYSLYMFLLAVLDLLLYRCTGQTDILVGCPIANRTHKDLESLIGYFSNTLVLRTRLEGNPDFKELLDRVREVTSDAYDNQDIPFEKLVEEFQPERYMSHTPLFQVMLVLQNAPGYGGGGGDNEAAGSLTIQPISVHSRTSKFDLWYSITQLDNKLHGIVEYNSDIFAVNTIKRQIGHFKALVEEAAQNPDQRLDKFTILTQEEKKQILEEWNDTAREYRLHRLEEMFAAQAEKTPGHTALVCGSSHLAYGELERQTNRAARGLAAAGIKPGQIVGIMMERSLELPLGLLAILKAGGAYLPLDTDYPEERIRYMLRDSNPGVLLTTPKLQLKVKAEVEENSRQPLQFVNIKTYPAFSSEPSLSTLASTLTCQVSLANLAYVIYTSGSTGRPRGVVIEHPGICNRLLWMQETFRMTGRDRVLQKTPYSFDVSVWEFFWPLISGAVLVMAAPGGHQDSAYLAETVIREHISTMHFVPTMLDMFLEEPGLSNIRSLKRVISSGEALPAEYRDRFYRQLAYLPGIQLHNLYGPTEASVDVTSYVCQRGSGDSTVPIGRPIANTRIYILDPMGNPVPIGVPGELHIGGIQLARGYLNRPELTAERFCLRRPGGALFEKTAPPGRRRQKLYKTGDLVRWREDGNIEFLGRLDFQVKVRGIRIELGEIESVLRDYHGVRDAVVLAREEVKGGTGKKLTAYIVPDFAHWGPRVGNDQVSDWQGVFEETYATVPEQAGFTFDPTFNIAGWNSSYTGKPIPAREMRIWVDRTVERILSLKAENIMEIGCGTGLLLFPLIRRCRRYLGTEIAARGLAYIEKQLKRLKEETPEAAEWAEVKLMQRPAHRFDGIDQNGIQLVILNSVVQYFPTMDYLVRVLTSALERLEPGGCIFIGDVRSLPLLDAFHTSVEYYRDQGSVRGQDVLERARQRRTLEKELVIDPDFFWALKERTPRIKHVEILPKYGRCSNELTRFRYDVILYTGKGDMKAPDRCEVNLSPEEVRHMLSTDETPGTVMVSGVTNGRVSRELELLKRLKSKGGTDREQHRRNHPANGGYIPDDFLEIGEEMGYHTRVLYPAHGDQTTFDIIFSRGGKEVASAANSETHVPVLERPWESYGSSPLLGKISARLVQELRDHLKDRLPQYMMPTHFVPLDRLPVTANGKLDRNALPPSGFGLTLTIPGGAGEDREARTPTQVFMVQVWKDVLLLEDLGVDDNFFQLGGDSINAIQVISRINRQGYNLSVRHLYQNMTAAELAEYLDKHRDELTLKEKSSQPMDMEFTIEASALSAYLPAGAEVEDIYPLTPFQRHMLRYSLNPPEGFSETGLFVNQIVKEIELEESAISVLTSAIQSLTDIYPYLRTGLMWEHNGPPVQVVYKRARAQFRSEDLGELEAGERGRRVEELIAADHAQNFDRRQPHVYRVCIIRLWGSRCLVLQTSDLMRVDGWSANLLMGIFSRYLEALSRGQRWEPEAGSAYKEYLTWLSQQDDSGGGDYWRAVARGCAIPTPLVARAPDNAPQNRRQKGFTSRYIHFSIEETVRIDDFLKKQQLVLSALGCAVWAFLLSHYTGHDPVIFGMLFSGRSSALPGVEQMIGQAMNILPLRIDREDDQTVSQWLKEIWNRLVELNSHDFHQQDKVREYWNIPGEIPLFESYFVLENFPGVKEGKQAALRAAREGSPYRINHDLRYLAQMEYPLRVEVSPLAELRITMHYYRRWFSSSSIEVMLKDFRALLLAFIENPYQQVEELKRLIANSPMPSTREGEEEYEYET